MGQKLERVSEKDEESLDNSECSEKTADTRLSKVAEQDDGRHQEDDSSAFSRLSIGGIRGINLGKLAVISSRTDPQSGQPISGQSQKEHLLNSRGEWVFPGRGAVSGTVAEPKRTLSFKKTQTSNKKQGSEQGAAAWTGTAAMDEPENQNFPETDSSKSSTTSCRPPTEEDFVVLERDEKWMSNESNTAGHHSKPRGEEDGSESCSDSKLSQPSRVTQEKSNDVVHGKSSHRYSLGTETGRDLAQVTGSRCQLKGASCVQAAQSKTTGEGTTEVVRMREEQKKCKDQRLEADQSPVNKKGQSL
ncbi:uncharacterized protein LOC119789010 [Cyprinodon tularosa]|uniref:uncharacterized protein LOC119789010 n=1 Tax=Cyprinodon tularosa TaxID=77115 RepID=UPI0018E1F2DD|nr:uncharacterized protein LOC119789010 [Cyprinodon tularosa]